MTGYYLLAGVSVAWALLLSAVGLTQRNFPRSKRLERALLGFAIVLAVTTVGVLVASTEVEHPLEDAAAEGKLGEAVKENQATKQAGNERAAKAGAEGGGANSVPTGANAGAVAGAAAKAVPAKAVPVKETEFKIAITGGNALKAGKYNFKVANGGQVEHDLAIEDSSPERKTPLIKSGGSADLKVTLKPGKYRFYCTVPGHAQAGMDNQVTVQ